MATGPLREISELIARAHADVIKDVEFLMEEQEKELRGRIREVLVQCGNALPDDKGKPPVPSGAANAGAA